MESNIQSRQGLV